MGLRIYERNGYYHFSITHKGKRLRRALGTTDKKEAEELAQKAFEEFKERFKEKSQLTPAAYYPLTTAIQEYSDHFSSKTVTDDHYTKTVKIICYFADRIGKTFVSDITVSDVVEAFDHMASSGMSGNNISGRTANYYRAIIKPFLAWLYQTDHLKKDLSKSLRRRRQVRTFSRRPLSQEEIVRLLNYSPIHRRVVYALAIYTGMRKSEIERVELSDIVLDSTNPRIQLPASKTKNRKAATLELTDYLADLLGSWLNDNRPTHNYVYHLSADRKPIKSSVSIHYSRIGRVRGKGAFASITSKTVKLDLEHAGIDRDNADGRVDFHSLRYTFIANLWRAGISPSDAVKLSRHSDPNITLGIYTTLNEQEKRSAINKLNSLDPRQ